MTNECYAAIDLGTNSCRLVIADNKGNYLYKDTVATRLGEGMYAQMKFTDEAVDRGIKCFCDYKREMDKYGVSQYRAIATASCRMASNGLDFVRQVKERTGIEIEVIDGLEEARLNLKGALQNVKGKSEYVVVYDLGGGSTEITLATNESDPKIIYSVSIPWGARNSSEAFDLVEYSDERAEKLRSEIAGYVREFVEKSHLKDYEGKMCFVATSSTPLRLISKIHAFGVFDREKADGCKASRKQFDEAIASIYKMSRVQMAEDVYIGEKRSFIFVPACVIFKTIYDGLGVEALTASLKSAKDGIIEELVEKYGKIDKICKRGSRPSYVDGAGQNFQISGQVFQSLAGKTIE